MPSDYVPYEKRQRQEAEQAAADASSQAADARAALLDVRAQLQRLGSSATDSFLEVLVPARGLRRFRKPVVVKHGVMGGPNFYIAEVVSSYRVEDAIHKGPWKDDLHGYFLSAFVVPDGRVWGFGGSGVTENTWHVLAASVRRLEDLGTMDLRRICTNLQTR